MSIETKLQERISRLQTAFTAANTAITSKGGTSATNISELADAVSTIPQGGGLPLGITEMESGQFTVPSDTEGRMTIQFTNFTEAPTHLVVWTKSVTPANNVIKNILYDANGIQYNDQITMRYNATGTALQAIIGYAFDPSATDIQVGNKSGHIWQGGVVYYWMAWR